MELNNTLQKVSSISYVKQKHYEKFNSNKLLLMELQNCLRENKIKENKILIELVFTRKNKEKFKRL